MSDRNKTKTEEEIKKEIEELEKHGESVCPECNICMACTMLNEKKAELKGITETKKEMEKAVDEIAKIDVEQEFEDYKGDRTEFVKMGFRLALNKVPVFLKSKLGLGK